MNSIVKESVKNISIGKKGYMYSELISFLDSSWHMRSIKNLDIMKQLDTALGNPSQKIKTIFIGGTNGKSSSIHFLSKLLKEEGLSVGVFSSPHFMTYNERLSISNEMISNADLTDIANDVISTAAQEKLDVTTSEYLIMTALLYFQQKKIDIAILEVSNPSIDPVMICTPSVMGITRLTDHTITSSQEMKQLVNNLIRPIDEGTLVISADQSKLNLQVMAECVKEKGCTWAMPIRKLIPLEYPYEQLQGRNAALAERIAQMYAQKFLASNATIVTESLLVKPKGTRGRPTLEAKRKSELNPGRSLDKFWKENAVMLHGRFQLLEQEKPTVLLDNARNMDAFKNLLLGIRLLHYKKPLKGLTLIMGCHEGTMDKEDFLKTIRYFFKKTPGQIIFYPVSSYKSQTDTHTSWDIDQITNETKNLKVKARAAKDIESALEYAQKYVDERSGLIVVTGSHTALNDYHNFKNSL